MSSYYRALQEYIHLILNMMESAGSSKPPGTIRRGLVVTIHHLVSEVCCPAGDVNNAPPFPVIFFFRLNCEKPSNANFGQRFKCH